MKKLITTALILVGSLITVPTAFAQDRNQNQDRQEHTYQDRQNRRGRGYDTWRNRHGNYGTYVVNEYRYVQIDHRVYKETYRSTYRRNGMLVNRILIDRERISRYDNYDRRRNSDGLRFNIFLRF